MAVQGVGAFLQDVLQEYDGKTTVVIGHRVTRYGLAYWSSDALLEAIVRTPWQWQDIPIWRYELHVHNLQHRFV